MTSVFDSVSGFTRSSIGRKWIVALTGAFLVFFVLGHLVGNLLVFKGPEALNNYAHMLKSMGKGVGVWFARGGLLLAAVLHIAFTIKLTAANRKARPQAYAKPLKPKRSTLASRWMIVSGLILLAFVVIHLVHFTLPLGQESREWTCELTGHHDVYRMVIESFHGRYIASAFYLLAMGVLCWHLAHGVASMFQTLGLSTPKTAPLFTKLALGYGALMFLGNAAIVLTILFGLIGQDAS